MRVLHTVHFYEPQKGGSEEVVKQLSERLAARGHDVTVATSWNSRRVPGDINGVHVRQFRVAGNMAQGLTGEADAYRKFVLEEKFDVVMNYAAQNWTTDALLPHLGELRARKVLVPCGYSGLRDPAYADYFRKLPGWLAEYDALVYMSPSTQDTVFGRENGLGAKETVIPNGAGEEFEGTQEDFRRRFNVRTPFLALTVGNHTGLKGHDFVLSAFREMKRKDVTLAIIGDRLADIRPWQGCWLKCLASSWLTPRVLLPRGIPRPLVVSAYLQADLFLFGSRVECAPLVMYEAFASRTPFVTIRVGNVADHSEVIRIVDNPAAMAAEANRLLDDEKARAEMAQGANALWKERHAWDVLSRKYEALCESLAGGRGIPK